MENFNKNLQDYLDNKGLKMTKYCQAMNMNTSTLGNYLSGDRLPKGDVIRRILEHDPDLSAEFLLRGRGPMYYSQFKNYYSEGSSTDSGDNFESIIIKQQLEEAQARIDYLTKAIEGKDELIKSLLDKMK